MMDDELQQCKHDLNNLRIQYELLQNEWHQSDELCHSLQIKICDQENVLKTLNQEIDKLRCREENLVRELDTADDKLQCLSQVERDLNMEKHRFRNLLLKISELKNFNDNLEKDKFDLETCLQNLCEKEGLIENELNAERMRCKNLEVRLKEVKAIADENRNEKEMLREIIREMNEEREAAAKQRSEELLLTPNNLFAEISASEMVLSTDYLKQTGSPVSCSTAFRHLDFTGGHCCSYDNDSVPSLGTEMLISENNALKEQVSVHNSQMKKLMKRLNLLLVRTQKQRKHLKILKQELKGQTADELHLEESVVTVVIKDGVQTGQPRVHVVETISIATQTERVAIVAAEVQTHGTLGIRLGIDSLSESDEESSESRRELDDTFSDHGPSPTDFEMDMYRSCRKLSVLPEEELDEGSLHRNSSLKSNLSARLCINLSQSADDVTSVRSLTNRNGKVASCGDILLSSNGTPAFCVSLSEVSNALSSPESLSSSSSSNEPRLCLLDPADAFRQPHSFDSYLDPQKIPQSLPRQISDPTQNNVCAPPLVRRGSYVKRPRSTCRPLTLTCDLKQNKGDERVPKVRFDLTEKEADESGGAKEVVLVSKLKPAKLLSRFRVEQVDETELQVDDVRRRPPLIHSVVYKKCVLQDLSPCDDCGKQLPLVVSQGEEMNKHAELVDEPFVHGNYLLDDIYPCKRRKQSDVSCASLESSEGDIVVKSIRLHNNSECLVMRDLSGDTSSDTEIPYIDAEELSEIMAEVSRTTQTDVSCFDTATYVVSPIGSIDFPELEVTSPSSSSVGPDMFTTSPSNSSSGTFCTATSELTPMTDDPPTKGLGLSKSPTVLKNLASIESFESPDAKHKLLPKHILEEEEELSESSDTVTYVTVKSDLQVFSSDCDSDTYVTVKSDLNTVSDADSDTYVTLKSERSYLEQKNSDLSEHSISPYNTPPDTSSASFCTPPDTSSPLLMKASRYPLMHSSSSTSSPRDTRSSSPCKGMRTGPNSNASSFNYDTPPSESPFQSPSRVLSQTSDNEVLIEVNQSGDRRRSEATFASDLILFESPKLEFYETNDSVENLEAFLESEEGLREEDPPIKRNSLDSASDGRFSERRTKRHPPLSRQNSTEEYIYLEPQDSSLNLSEEISSPSTTPDTSNKTVIFKNKPLTVSNTIDLDDDDFPISESEIIINLNGSETEIVEIPLIHTCRSEPCIPSMSKSTLACLSRQSCSMSEEPDTCNYPSIVISSVSSESEESSLCKIPSKPRVSSQNMISDLSPTSEIRPSRPPCPLPEASLVPQEAGSETLGQSDADSSDSGCKLISLEADTSNGSSEQSLTQCPNTEISLPNVMEALKSLTEDEIEARAQKLALALQTDAQTLIRRLQLRQRQRDLAEKNLESEIERMRRAMQSLQYLCTDCNSLDVLTTVRTQLECVLASAVSISSSAEAYGFVQCEERMATAVAPLVRYVDNVANTRLEKPLQSPRSPFLNLEESRDDERVMRRRSVAAVPLSLESRRRASIPFLPRPPSPLTKNGIPSQPTSPGLDLSRRDSSALRQRRENRTADIQMEEIRESPERQSPPNSPCSCSSLPSTPHSTASRLDKPVDIPMNFTGLCRAMFSCHMEYFQLAQFRWPIVSRQVVPFLLTWYLVFCCIAVFSLGLHLGRRSGAVT